jgi:hypothetical protein
VAWTWTRSVRRKKRESLGLLLTFESMIARLLIEFTTNLSPDLNCDTDRDISSTFAQTKADAVLYAPYGGEEAGSGLADVLWGKVNPSARMPVTVYKQAWADAMNCKNYTESPGRARKYNADCDTSILQLDLERGIGRTHRYLSDVATYVRCGAAMRAGDLMI